MRDAISDSDRQSLFRKLAIAISEGNTDRALKMIGKGAALDVSYYERGDKDPSFYSDSSEVSSTHKREFTVFKGTPILVAAKKANTLVVQRLKEYGANTSAKGTEYLYKKEITGVSSHPELVSRSTIVTGRDGRARVVPTYEIQHRTVVHTADSRTNHKQYRLDENLRLALA